MLIISSLILIISYIFIAQEKLPKVTVAMLGAATMLLIQRVPAKTVFSHVDFSVIFLLISMMIVVHITARSGVFKWIAFEMIKKTQGNPKWILLSIGLFTALFSAFLDNVTTVVLILPVIFAICKKMELNPIPFLITTILTSNIGGAATLIGDPPNIIIGSAAGLSFMDFIRELSFVIILIFTVSIPILITMFKKDLIYTPKHREIINEIDNKGTIKDKKLMIRSTAVLGLVILGFILHDIIHVDAYVIATLGASILMLFESPKQVIHEVEWSTIFFFVALFLIVGGFAEAGGIEYLANLMLKLTGGNPKITTMVILWASGFFSAIVDNIPFTATMVPMIHSLKTSMDVYPLWWALSLGACLGGNATIIGAAANVIVVEAANARGYKISFLNFMKYGIIITIISLIISSIYLYYRFLI
jgi:Na+/H+ antiporter NhaD/arsenite permease-like protein